MAIMPGAMNDGHIDPDAQATVTDFLDYTEHLPSDVERSLTLLRKQDALYHETTQTLHDLLTTYGALNPAATDPYESQHMRSQISYLLDLVVKRRESSFAEATRLYDEVDRHYNRLNSVKAKLLALPTPPSRDPTPVPMPKSPQQDRGRSGQHLRLNLKLDKSKLYGGLPRPSRKGRVLIPGEVLPPPDPDSPTPSLGSDWDESPSPIRETTIRVGVSRPRSEKPPRIRAPKALKPPKEHRERDAKPKKDKPPRLPGQLGTNVHSAVAGISTSNALSLLTPPPADAKLGSKWAPWFRLTEWEMAKLRKRMKKNAIWTPSETMIRRELHDAGRGPDGYQRGRQKAEDDGEPLVDVDAEHRDPTRALGPGEISAETKSKITNKGMSLNVQKKEKKAAQKLIEEQQAREDLDKLNTSLSSLPFNMRDLFRKDSPGSPAMSAPVPPTPAAVSAKAPKRKREPSISTTESQVQAQLQAEMAQRQSPSVNPRPATKKRKTSDRAQTSEANGTATVASITTVTTVPLAVAASSPVKQPAFASTTPAEPSALTIQPKEHTTRSTNIASTKPSKFSTVSATTATTNLTINPPKPPGSTHHRRPSLILKPPGSNARAKDRSLEPPRSAPPTRMTSRPASRRASIGPGSGESAPLREGLRRKSGTPGLGTGVSRPASAGGHTRNESHGGGVTTAAGRRSKRPVPGIVTNAGDGGAAVSVGRRKSAPGGKKGARREDRENKKVAPVEETEEIEDEDEDDPNEPKYCKCNRVSFGTMVCCENPEVSISSIESSSCVAASVGLTADRESSCLVSERRVVPPGVCGSDGGATKTRQVVVSRM